MEAEDYDTAKALKQNIERLRLAGEASSSRRAANGQQGLHSGRSNGYGHDGGSTRNQVKLAAGTPTRIFLVSADSVRASAALV